MLLRLRWRSLAVPTKGFLPICTKIVFVFVHRRLRSTAAATDSHAITPEDAAEGETKKGNKCPIFPAATREKLQEDIEDDCFAAAATLEAE